MDKQQILDKLEKLQQMTSSTNRQEAETANIMMQKLMQKYNIAENQLNKIQTNAISVEMAQVQLKFSIRSWVMRLAATIADCYECRATVTSKSRKVTFIGFSPDIDVAAQMFQYTYNVFKTLSEQIKTDSPSQSLIKRNSYLSGCVDGLISKVEEIENEKVKNQQALVLLKEKEIEKWLPDIHANPGHSIADKTSYLLGYKQGYSQPLQAELQHTGGREK